MHASLLTCIGLCASGSEQLTVLAINMSIYAVQSGRLPPHG